MRLENSRQFQAGPRISFNRDRRTFDEKMQGGMSREWVDVV
jgi:hypothetical protein